MIPATAIETREPCPACRGSGRSDNLHDETCQWCDGSGREWVVPGQSRLFSLLEAKANILIGFGINWVANLIILPLYGFPVTGRQAFSMGLLYTGISLGRQYALRRWFNRLAR